MAITRVCLPKKRSEIRRTPPARLSFPTKIRLFSLFAACLEEEARKQASERRVVATLARAS